MEPLEYFKCPDCGYRNLVFQSHFTLVEHFELTISCDCDQGEDGVAYDRSYSRSSNQVKCHWLDNGHRLGEPAEDFEDINPDHEEETQEEQIHCSDCHEANLGRNECTTLDYDPDDNEIIYEEPSLVCGNCEREIEFGWSHQKRGGRIWPEETIKSDDFKPWKTIPEDRYIESWYKKGWLHRQSEKIVEEHGFDALRRVYGYI